MSEDNNIVLTSKEPSLGEVRLAPEVIEVIIGIAASQVDGVFDAWVDRQQLFRTLRPSNSRERCQSQQR